MTTQPPAPALLGDLLADRYRIEEEIGRGGASTVYLAEDLKHGRKVAIKLFRPAPGGSYEPQRFLRYFEEMAPYSAVVLAKAEAVAR